MKGGVFIMICQLIIIGVVIYFLDKLFKHGMNFTVTIKNNEDTKKEKETKK